MVRPCIATFSGGGDGSSGVNHDVCGHVQPYDGAGDCSCHVHGFHSADLIGRQAAEQASRGSSAVWILLGQSGDTPLIPGLILKEQIYPGLLSSLRAQLGFCHVKFGANIQSSVSSLRDESTRPSFVPASTVRILLRQSGGT